MRFVYAAAAALSFASAPASADLVTFEEGTYTPVAPNAFKSGRTFFGGPNISFVDGSLQSSGLVGISSEGGRFEVAFDLLGSVEYQFFADGGAAIGAPVQISSLDRFTRFVAEGSATQFAFRVVDGSFRLDNLLVAPVPEPATWAMMILGFGAVGAIRRRLQPARHARQLP
jgi:hypothetical protein